MAFLLIESSIHGTEILSIVDSANEIDVAPVVQKRKADMAGDVKNLEPKPNIQRRYFIVSVKEV